jgi:hypothetical protein
VLGRGETQNPAMIAAAIGLVRIWLSSSAPDRSPGKTRWDKARRDASTDRTKP